MSASTSHETVPLPALALGAAGLIPLVATSLQVATGWPLSPRLTGPALYNLTLYAGVILSFLGGVQWGLALARPPSVSVQSWRRYGISILPSLAAWAGLWFAARNGLLLLAASFVASLAYDLWTVRLGEAPRWYGRLRIGLTAVVVAALLAAALLGPLG
jgi:Protein of unknown function (DUF3429)